MGREIGRDWRRFEERLQRGQELQRPGEIMGDWRKVKKGSEVGVAQAIYDNQAEWPDELAFERGEILRVLNERPCANSGVGINTGWWCCINKNGRRGIVPANRLRMLHRFDQNTSPQESISSSSSSFINRDNNSDNRRRFMFNSTGRLATSPTFIDENDSFDGIASSFANEFINSSTFDSGSLFDRIFPLSPLEHYKDTSLRHMSNGITGLPPYGVVRNIPIKVEGTSLNGVSNNNFDKIRNDTPIITNNRHYNNEPSSPILSYYQRKFESGGHISPPPPPQRKFFNPSTSSLNATVASSSSSNEIISSDEDHRRLKKADNPDLFTTRILNRSSIAPKPKFDNRDISTSLNGTISTDDSAVPKLTLNKNLTFKGHGLHWSTHLDSGTTSTGAQNTSSSNESESGNLVVVNASTIQHDEISSSSPSSSGIVADMNDSNGESNQRTSVTSSLSSCEPPSDLIESNFDTSRLGKTYRSRIDDSLILAQNHRHQQQQQQQTNHSNDVTGVAVVQRPQLERIREPSGLIMPTLEEKIEPSNNRSNLSIDFGISDNTEPRFNHSLNLNNHRNFAQRSNRSSSIPPEGIHGNRYASEDRFRRSGSIAPELTNQHQSLNSIGNNSTNDENTKKQIICSKLVEHYRHIENSVEKLDKCTAARAWRQPHILQQNIFDIKEYVGIITNSINGFLDAACRIAIIDINNPKGEELKQLLLPLKSSVAIINQLKQNLDNTGWTLSALSRPRNIYGTIPGSDALDQFLAVMKQLPIDCCKLIQWALLMVPSSGVRFLTNGLKDPFLNTDNITTNIYQPYNDSLSGIYETNSRTSMGTDSKRQSTSSTTSTLTISSSNDTQSPSSILASRTTFGPATTPTTESHVLEEDDLESVISDRDSFYQDSAAGGDDAVVSRRMRPVTSLPPLSLLDAEVIKSLSEDDRQLIEFYSPQLDAHIEFLSKAIEEFLTVIEERMPPHEFVQKGKLIILTAHKLIYMADTIAEFISSGDVSKEVKRSADRLLDVLKTCVQATKHAADEYLSVSAVQSMANCIVTVSRAAYDLKLLVKQCCSNA
ncbi:Enhancer of filamentation [Dirofilaria immitis]